MLFIKNTCLLPLLFTRLPTTNFPLPAWIADLINFSLSVLPFALSLKINLSSASILNFNLTFLCQLFPALATFNGINVLPPILPLCSCCSKSSTARPLSFGTALNPTCDCMVFMSLPFAGSTVLADLKNVGFLCVKFFFAVTGIVLPFTSNAALLNVLRTVFGIALLLSFSK